MVKYDFVVENKRGEKYVRKQDVLKLSNLPKSKLNELEVYNILCNDDIDKINIKCFLLSDVEKLEKENEREDVEENKVEECEDIEVEDKLIIINDDITQSKCDRIIKDFIKFEEDTSKIHENKKPKLIMRISSYGGDVHVANTIISYMEYLKSKGIFITTIACGFANSSGMLIFMHGDKRIFLNKEYSMLL